MGVSMPKWHVLAVDLAGNTWEVKGSPTHDPYEALRLTLSKDHLSEQLRISYEDGNEEAGDGRLDEYIENAELAAMAHIIEAWVA